MKTSRPKKTGMLAPIAVCFLFFWHLPRRRRLRHHWHLASTLTCTLTSDIITMSTSAYGIYIGSDGITLDGGGHTLTGDGTTNSSIGVNLVDGISGATVKNLNVTNFECGILQGNDSNNTVSGNTVNTSGWGIYLDVTSGSCSGNTVSGNTVSFSTGTGIVASPAIGNRIYHNNFIGNAAQASVASVSSDRNLSGVTFVDASHGWAVGASGAILATTDGGATWNAQGSGTSNALPLQRRLRL